MDQKYTRLYFYASLIAVATLLRTIFTAPVQTFDALRKWVFVKNLLDGAPLTAFLEDHHTARWGVNLPALTFSSVFGWSWTTYYLIIIVFFSCFLAASAYFLEKYGKGTLSVPIFLLVFFANPLYFSATSQLDTFIFVAVFIMLHTIFVARSVEGSNQSNYLLAALFMFLAYGAKETALLYVPASAAFIILALGWRRGLLTLAYVGAYGLLFIAIETIGISLIAGKLIPTGHLALLGHHFDAVDKLYPKFGFLDFFDGWQHLPPFAALFFAAGFASSVYLIANSTKQRRVSPAILPSLMFLSFAIFHTFAMKSVSPLLPALPPRSKYLADLVPWASLAIGLAVGDLVAKARNRSYARALPIAALALAAAICVVALSRPGQDRGVYPLARAWMWHADDSYEFLSGLVRAGVPISIDTRGGEKGRLENLLSVDLLRLERGHGRTIFGVPAKGLVEGQRPEFCIDGESLRTKPEILPCPISKKGN